jgi:signal transduction histidine kinase
MDSSMPARVADPPTVDAPAAEVPAPDSPTTSPVVRSAVVRFTVWSLVMLLVLTAGAVLVANQIAKRQALADARAQASAIANKLAAPLVNREVRERGLPAADRLNTVMMTRMADGSVRHVKLWDEDGRVIWSDEQDLVGQKFPMEEDVTELFNTKAATAELSDLSKEENQFEQSEGELLEVYAGTFDADGEPLVFEAYLTTEQMRSAAQTILVNLVPLILGTLALFMLAVLPLAMSLARRVERAQLDRSKMMRHALLASDLERRRIAQDLHDGVIQDLAGLGYVLPTAQREIHEGGNLALARTTLDRATGMLQQDVVRLRSLLTDLYPPDLQGQGLVSAVGDLVQTMTSDAGLDATVRIDPALDVPVDAGRLAYRVVREGLRNVVKHADANSVVVEVRREADDVLVRVADDGRGPVSAPGVTPRGHLGLRLLKDTLSDFGGRLDLEPGPRQGTALLARFPVALIPA